MHGPGRVLMLSANRWPSISVYPDSDKVGPRPAAWGTHDPDRLNFRRETRSTTGTARNERNLFDVETPRTGAIRPATTRRTRGSAR